MRRYCVRHRVRNRIPEREVRGSDARILTEGITNSYTISKKGQRKLIHQTPWYKDAADGSGKTVAGIIELSIVIPEQMPHYDRG